MQTKNCKYCNKIFNKPLHESLKNWSERHLFCSVNCRNKGSNKEKLIFRMKNNNPMSHGGIISYKRKEYKAIHKWVYDNFGKPNQCEDCLEIKNGKYQLHWSNESGKYIRDRSDWKRRCPKCHVKHDKRLYAKT